MLKGRRQQRRGRLLSLTAAIAIIAVPVGLSLSSAGAAVAGPQAGLATGPASHTTCKTSNRSSTCTGTYTGALAGEMNWNTTKWKQFTQQPVVTVTPSTGLVNQVVHVQWANFTPTISTSLLTPQPNANNGAATGASQLDPPEIYPLAIYECRGTDPKGPVGDGISQTAGGDCYDITDNSQGNAQFGQANGVYAFTSGNGTGEANVFVEADADNSFLKCSESSPCSLVVVPNWGGQDRVPSALQSGKYLPQDCASHNADDGDTADGGYDLASYPYIGAPCSWNDRIVIPLSFAPTSTNCPASTPSFYAVGSPGMEAAIGQWQASWCTAKPAVSFTYTNLDEYSARQSFLSGGSALTASTDMALVSEPATSTNSNGELPSARQFTYAPLANSAVAFVYLIDNPTTGAPYQNLVLNARLATKLLTQSYSLQYNCAGEKVKLSYTCDPNVANNPQTLFDDPEFLSANKGASFIPDSASPDALYGSFLPLVTNANSDMTYEMTGWIASDAAAAQFLKGTREKDGTYNMAVNTAYRNIAYPENELSVLDQGWSGPPDTNPLLDDQTMNVAWIPNPELDQVTVDLATYSPTSQYPYVTCPATVNCKGGSSTGWINKTVLGEYLGQNGMTGVLPYSDAANNLLPSFKLVNAAGNAVAPSISSIEDAVDQMKTNPDGITQSANFTSRSPDAYPLATVDYAMVPTCGLSAAKASAISAFLTDASSKQAQTPGYLPGQLAPGYAPLNSHQLGQLKAAASKVATKGKQACPSSGGGHSGSGSSGGGTGSAGTGSTGGSKGGKSGTNPQTTAQLGKSKTHNAGYAVKDPFTAGLGRLILPLLVIIGGLLGLGGPVAYVVGANGGWPALQQRIGKLPHRIVALPRRVAGLVRGTRVRGS